MLFSKKFNTEQLKAITADLKPTVVIAGAGTGKTSILINRIVYLVKELKIEPEKIFVLTFTNQAIFEIKYRISKEKITPPNISTCHQMCLELLKKYSTKYKNFKTLSESESQKFWKNALDKKNKTLENPRSFKPIEISNIYSAMQLKATPEGKLKIFETLSDNLSETLDKEEFREIVNNYNLQKISNNCLDFNDLLTQCNKLLDNQELMLKIKDDFHAILVDEFQDIDEIQFSIIKKLTQFGAHIFCVGDPDQSIYSFRGTDPKIFDNFKKHFTNNNIIKLEENFRSTPEILHIANTLINKNSSEFNKTLYTKNPNGDAVVFCYADNEWDSIDWIIQKIEQLNVPLNEIAILYRNKSHALKIETMFKKKFIPYRVFGSKKSSDAPEVKHMISYLNLIYFEDSVSMESIINVPAKGLGPKYIEQIHNIMDDYDITFYQAVFKIVEENIQNHIKAEKLIPFVEQIKQIKALKNEDNVVEIAKKILEITQYLTHWSEDEMESREANILSFMCEIQNTCSEQNITIAESVKNISIYHNNEKLKDKKQDAINLSTIHQSKGLEFKYVFIIKMNKGQIPHFKSWKDNTGDEERRIAYVAITRAKLKLFLCSFADESYFYKKFKDEQQLNHSEYIEELGNLLKTIRLKKNRPSEKWKKFDKKYEYY